MTGEMTAAVRGARLAYGAALLAAPGRFVPDDRFLRKAARLLGARHAGEALLPWRHGRVLAIVDVLHSGSMVAYGVREGRGRRAALERAAVSLTFAATSAMREQRARRGHERHAVAALVACT